MAIAQEDIQDNAPAVTHIACDLCDGDVANCPSRPSVFHRSYAELILEAPADLKRECQGWHHEFDRSGDHPEEYWSAYYNMEYGGS